MPHFGWKDLARLLILLTALAAFLRLEGPAAEPAGYATDQRPFEPAFAAPPTTETASREARPGAATTAPSPAPGAASARGTAAPETDTTAGAEASAAILSTTSPVRADVRAPEGRSPASLVSRSGAVPRGRGEFSVNCGDVGGFLDGDRIFFPLPEAFLNSYEDTWGAPRAQGGHEGTDLMVPTGTPEYAMTDGTVVRVSGSNADGWNTLGGYAVMIEAARSVGPIEMGDLLYYAHLDRESPLPVGTKVRAGQVLGRAGDTGQGPEGTRGLFPPHLHFGWYDATGTRSDLDSGAMNPYPLLEWVRATGGTGNPTAVDCGGSGVGAPVPPGGDGGDRWQDDATPGVGPDLDTGSKNPAPSPSADRRSPDQRTPTGDAPGKERGPRASTADRADPKETRATPGTSRGTETRDRKPEAVEKPAAKRPEPDPQPSPKSEARKPPALTKKDPPSARKNPGSTAGQSPEAGGKPEDELQRAPVRTDPSNGEAPEEPENRGQEGAGKNEDAPRQDPGEPPAGGGPKQDPQPPEEQPLPPRDPTADDPGGSDNPDAGEGGQADEAAPAPTETDPKIDQYAPELRAGR